jgi:hemerythrin
MQTPCMVQVPLVCDSPCWDDSLSVGVAALDEEHRHWFELVRAFQDGMASGLEPARLYGILAQALLYTENHLANEENAMRLVGYPGYADHKRQHEVAKDAIHRISAEAAEDHEIFEFLAVFLPDWLTRHIHSTDRKFADWMRETNCQYHPLTRDHEAMKGGGRHAA